MTLGMYSASVPVFVRMLGNLSAWLHKAETHATAKKFDSVVFLGTRLAPDMLPLVKQVQIACDSAKFCVSRLGGLEAPKFEDNEATLAELQERVAKTVAFIQTATPAQLDGTENREVTVPRRNEPMQMQGEAYLKFFVLPNVYFHLTTTYALLRHNGVELGKGDFLGLS
jgi:uncharacterized protein